MKPGRFPASKKTPAFLFAATLAVISAFLGSLSGCAGGTTTEADNPGLTANKHTKPIPTDPKKKAVAATKVLQEGVTGENKGAEAAIDRLPDRIIASRVRPRPKAKPFHSLGSIPLRRSTLG